MKNFNVIFVCFLFWNRAYSWDVAITVKNVIEFYSKGHNIKTLHGPFVDLGDITFDAINERIFFVDNYPKTATIYSYNLMTNRNTTIIANTPGFIPSVAFDPVTNTLFWTNTKVKAVFWINVGDSGGDAVPNVFVKDFTGNMFPIAIAVDSCRGYVYWTTWDVDRQSSNIQKSRIDGTKRQKIMDTDLDFPNGLVVDEKKGMLYWIDTTVDQHYSIKGSDLNGGSRVTLLSGYKNVPIDLAVSNHALFWNDEWSRHIWKLKKTNDNHMPSIYKETNSGVAMVANYKIDERIDDVLECSALRSIIDSEDKEEDKEETVCDGEACELSNCEINCLQGECIKAEDGNRVCVCYTGFRGERCDLKILHNAGKLPLKNEYLVICSIIISIFLTNFS